MLLIGTLLWRRLFPTAKYVAVLLITAGISLFMLQKVKKGGSTSSVVDDDAVLIGRLLLLGSLACDGITGALQDALVGARRPSAYHLMMWNNLWASFYLGAALLVTGGLARGYAFAATHPALVGMMAAFALTSAAGQMFIYYTVRWHGSLVCTMVTTTRKFFTILLSVLLYGHVLAATQWLAVAVVFAGLGIDIVFSSRAKKADAKKDN